MQVKTTILPDYTLDRFKERSQGGRGTTEAATAPDKEDASGTGIAGIVGGLLTLAVAFLSGQFLKRRGNSTCR